MGSTGKAFALFFVLIVAILSLSVLMVKHACAQGLLPAPSIPEFTLMLDDHSYEVPTTYSTDPYTGQNVTHPGCYVENKTIDIIITNQPFGSINVFYDVRVKGHFEDNWTQLYSYDNDSNHLLQQSASEYTVISTPQNYTSTSQIDFQVESVAGVLRGPNNPNAFWEYATKGWSNAQTITIPSSPNPTTSLTPTPTLTQTPTTMPTSTITIAEFPTMVILPLFVAILLIAALRKNLRLETYSK